MYKKYQITLRSTFTRKSAVECTVSSYFAVTSHIGLKTKGKAIPLQAWSGPECSRRLRLPDFKTMGT